MSTEIIELKEKESLDYELLLPEEKMKVDELKNSISVLDSNDIIQYASEVQGKMADFSNQMMSNMKTKSAGEVGDVLSTLVAEINEFEPNDTGRFAFITRFFRSAKSTVKKMVAKYSTVETNIDRIVGQLELGKVQLTKDIVMFDDMFNENVKFFKDISLYIIAANQKIDELRKVELPKLQKKADESKLATDIQAVNDLSAAINKLEKKVHDLSLSRMVSIQMAPQIRMLQSNDVELVDKIQSTIVNTIPLWKSQVLLALGVNNAKMAYNAQNKVTEATNNLLRKNGELLKTGSLEIAKASERAIIDLEVLKQNNQNIISTIEEVIKIHRDGAVKRAEAENELVNIENTLKEELSKYRDI